MLTKFTPLFILVSILLMLNASAQKSNSGVSEYPEYYHTVFENDHIHAYEMFASPGAAASIHTHKPSVWVSLGKSRFEVTDTEGNAAILDLNPAEAFWANETQHSWQLLSGRAHLFIVEVKSAKAGASPAASNPGPDDSVVVDPIHHHVLFDNDHVRVYEGLASPGAKSATHTHPPTLLISLTKSRFRVSSGEATWYYDFNPSSVRWIGHFKHTWEIVAGDAHVFGIEIKSAASANYK